MNSTYNTKQKNDILDFLNKNKAEQYSCEKLTDCLKKSGKAVSKTTVYRYLEKLSNEGKIRKTVDSIGKCAVYQLIDEDMECHRHLHLKCTGCGKFIHLSCEFMSEVSSHILEHHNFMLDNNKSVLYGVCDKCSSNV